MPPETIEIMGAEVVRSPAPPERKNGDDCPFLKRFCHNRCDCDKCDNGIIIDWQNNSASECSCREWHRMTK